jgi:hypothetical protein
MLRHIIALPILLVSLLATGVPASACATDVATQDCCPTGPHAPCTPDQAKTSQVNRPDFCCLISGIAATNAMATSADEGGKYWDRAAPAAFFVELTTLATPYVLPSFLDELHVLSLPLADSTLYLSTGRLRL